MEYISVISQLHIPLPLFAKRNWYTVGVAHQCHQVAVAAYTVNAYKAVEHEPWALRLRSTGVATNGHHEARQALIMLPEKRRLQIMRKAADRGVAGRRISQVKSSSRM